MSAVLQANTLEILRKRYFRKDEAGRIQEDFPGLCRRVARCVAQAEPDEPRGRRAEVEEAFYRLMESRTFLPNSPTLFNAGTPQPMLSACFILPVDDSIRGIYQSIADGAVIEKLGGGIGMDFSQLRPQGARTALGGTASGPLSFMTSFQAMSETIRQGGRRRGAMMAMLDVHHPDILAFLDAKRSTPPERARQLARQHQLPESVAQELLATLGWQAPYAGFNLTVKLTDAFMAAVESDGLYPLRDPRGGPWNDPIADPRGELRARRLPEGGMGLPARAVWQRIVANAWQTAEPGIAFIDRINRDNPVKSLGLIHSSNPCGEYWQVDYNSCNLGSLNLTQFLRSNRSIDWARLARTARTAARFLDHVITVSQYPIPEIASVTRQTRPTGLGVMGYADLLLALGLRYGSPESIALAGRLMQWIQYWAWIESVQMAREFGPFPELDRNRGYFDAKMRQLSERFGQTFTGPEFITLGDEAPSRNLDELYRQWGVRNCQVTVEAPTGSLSLIAECSSGIEPVFAFAYDRQDSLGSRAYQHPAIAAWTQASPGQPLPDYFVDAAAVTPEQHILVQAAFQEHVDNAVSKTVNLPAGASEHDVEQAYGLAYEHGLKSVTVYVEGSREGVLRRSTPRPDAAAGAVAAPAAAPLAAAAPADAIVRPEYLRGLTRKIRTPAGTVYVTVNYDTGARQITEVFVRESSGNEAWELIGRLLSLLLRARVPLQKILPQLYRTRGQNTIVLDQRILTSTAQAIARTLESAEEIFRSSAAGTAALPAAAPEPAVTSARARECPECGRAALYPSGGCLTCVRCGYSTCGGSMN